jgi:predicted Fe-S protein YdhL (DUF1289 family)
MTVNNNVSQQKSPITDVIASPCIRNCCLDNHDICVGCFRTLDEIVSWQRLNTNEKKQVLVQCQLRQPKT